MRVAVIGGGAVGLCCARELADRGADVVVVERGRCGGAASLGNAGWITPAFSTPITAPGTVGRALRWMVTRKGPFRVRPRLDAGFARWCWAFWRSCTPARYRAGTTALLRLNARTIELFDRLRERVDFELHTGGVLFVGLDEEELLEHEHVIAELRAFGYEGDVEPLDAQAVREREPALSDRVAGGFHVHAERYVRPESFTAALERSLRQDGVEIREGTNVGTPAPENGRWRVSDVVADRVVLAAGAWTGELLLALGTPLPLEPAKGYSITARGTGTRPVHALYLPAAKVACSPFEDSVRLTGILELSGLNLRLDRRRLDAVVRTAARYLRDWRPADPELEWCGLRSFAPDGLPVIGAVPGREGVFVATAHGMLGITLAPATAAALAPLVVDGEPPPELLPFSPARFAA